jgi:MFS family permease
MNGVSHFDNGRRLGRRASFVLLVCANVLMMATASAPSPIYPPYRERWGLSVTMLAVIFAGYVAGLLGALLTAGSLSDHLGRRPVLVAALLVAAAGTAIFWAADGAGSLLIARLVQGLTTGTATGALAALLTLAFVSLVVVVLVIPEPHTRRAGGLALLRPRVRVPREARPEFPALVPAIVAGWSMTGLFLALTPSLVTTVLHVGFGDQREGPVGGVLRRLRDQLHGTERPVSGGRAVLSPTTTPYRRTFLKGFEHASDHRARP